MENGKLENPGRLPTTGCDVFLLLWCFSVSNGALLAGNSWVLSSWDKGTLSSEWLIIHLCIPPSLSMQQFCFHLRRSQIPSPVQRHCYNFRALVLRMTLTQVPRFDPLRGQLLLASGCLIFDMGAGLRARRPTTQSCLYNCSYPKLRL